MPWPVHTRSDYVADAANVIASITERRRQRTADARLLVRAGC
jgi:hypothetical protein